MNTTVITKRTGEVSPQSRARITGALYLSAVVAAVSGEVALQGKLAIIAGLAAVACYLAVTVLIYQIFGVVNRNLCSLAVSVNFIGLGFEALRWNPYGVDIAMVFHGLYCLAIGCIIFRSSLVPRTLGLLMAFAGLCWLTFLSPSFADQFGAYLTAPGLLGEGLPCLWLLAFGVRLERWNELVHVTHEWRSVSAA